MHSVLEGVVKSLFNFWFGAEYSQCAFSIRKYMQAIETRLLLIRPPSFVPTTPRSLYTYNHWRAHEYLAFIMFYAQPVFKQIMSLDHYENLAKLVVFLEVILAPTIYKDKLEIANLLIKEFVSELSNLYQPNIMLSGVHELLHLSECTLEFGPLNQTNCFQFEEMNRKVINLIHGKDLIGEEFIKIFSTVQCLNEYTHLSQNQTLKNFVNKYSKFGTSNRKHSFVSQTVSTMGLMPTTSFDVSYLNAFEKKTNHQVQSLELYDKIFVNNIVYTTNLNSTKNCDYCFVNKEGKIGLILHFFKFQDTFFAISKPLLSLFNPRYNRKGKTLCSQTSLCSMTKEEIFIERITNIQKISLIQLQDATYVSFFRTSHLFN
jgi:hypothetical protein